MLMSIVRTAIITISVEICSIFTFINLVWYTLSDFLFRITGYKTRFYHFKHFNEKSCHISSYSLKFIAWIENCPGSDAISLMDFITFSEKIEMCINLIFQHEVFPADFILFPLGSILNSIKERIECIIWSIGLYEFIHSCLISVYIIKNKLIKLM